MSDLIGSDLISRQAAIDALGERPTVWTSCDEYALGERNQYDCDRLAIETVPPAVVRCKDCGNFNKTMLLIPQTEPLTNADRIRAMTDEELAELLEGEYGNMMPNTALSWLKKEVDDATD